MNRKVKRIVALVLALAIMFTTCGNLAFASEGPSPQFSVETVMQDYHDALQRILISESASTTSSSYNYGGHKVTHTENF